MSLSKVNSFMPAVYSNTRHRRLVLSAKWLVDGFGVFLLAFLYLYRELPFFILPAVVFLFGVIRPGLRYRLRSYSMDEERDVIIEVGVPSRYVVLSQVSDIVYMTGSGDVLDSLVLYDNLGHSLEVFTSRRTADAMVENIRRINNTMCRCSEISFFAQ